jgi:hypothetical protein
MHHRMLFLIPAVTCASAASANDVFFFSLAIFSCFVLFICVMERIHKWHNR